MNYLIIGLSLILVSCSTPRKQFTHGAYNNPREVKLLDDKFNEADMQQISYTMVNSLLSCSKVTERQPTIILGDVINQTEEHLNLDSVMDQIQNQLVNSPKYVFVDKAVRSQAEEEYSYQKNKNIYKGEAPLHAQYILHGAISSNVQQVKDDKMVYYKMNLKITNLYNTAVICSVEKELRKEFKAVVVD